MGNDNIKTITRADLANAITKEFCVTKFVALEIVEDILDEISSALMAGENVKISGLGTFSVRKKKARIGRNPKTLEEAYITPRRTVSFKASSLLKSAMNKKS
ncbi:MAG: integration host factor subunit alpha [Holosporaceae bacterium]|jgi:integration host factor subunit alpha|nr:integration host factor subunit alpha [Holosporaceae bacterium]